MTSRAGVFGERLRAYRAAARLSQEELAGRSGVSVRAIGDMERGRTRWPYRGSVHRLADALGITDEEREGFLALARRPVAGVPTLTGRAAELSQHNQLPGSPAAVVPRQLPAAIPRFSGRAVELKALDELLADASSTRLGAAGTVVISAIGGTAGVGKTTLALHWAHLIAAHFPDGQLYVNLRGHDPSGEPVPAAYVLAGFLLAFGIPAEQIPADPEAQSGLFRSLLAGKQVLVLLDNAKDAAQVRPLLPGSAGCLVIVTSRSQLTALAVADDARLLPLDVLPEPEATELLTSRLNADRAAAEPDAVTTLVRLCAGLPLALTITAARLAADPRLPIAALAVELSETRLEALDAGDPLADLRAVFSWSYGQLSPGAARLFRLAGIHPGPDTSAQAAASLAAVPLERARAGLRELTGASLITEYLPGRYVLHDLLRAYAAEQAGTAEDPAAHRDAVGRVLDHYLHTAFAAALLYATPTSAITLDPPKPGVLAEELADEYDALAWIAAERQVLVRAVSLAADRGFSAHAWKLAWALVSFLDAQGHWAQLDVVLRIALTSAEQSGDLTGQALAHQHLSSAAIRLGSSGQALTHLHNALRLHQRRGDVPNEALVRYGYGRAYAAQGQFREAIPHIEQGLEQFRAVGHSPGQARGLINLGWCHAHVGNLKRALACCQASLDLFRELDDWSGQAHAWHNLGYTQHCMGRNTEAITAYQHAASLFHSHDDRYNWCEALIHLGDACKADGLPRQAAEAWEQAITTLEQLRHPAAEKIQGKLRRLGRP